jgi:hypothetical protein
MATPDGGIDAQTPALREGWFRRMLGPFPPGRLIDLGAGHGAFSLMAADMGWTVTALDARKKRFQDDPRIEWVVGDVREADLGAYDLIACLGLFYHLTLEDQLDLLKRASGTPIILDTHVSNGAPNEFEPQLSPVRRVDGYEGRLFRELDAAHPTASWGNEHSFWPTPEEQLRMLDETGYDVLEAEPWYLPTRTFWLCLPRDPRRARATEKSRRRWFGRA